MNKILLVSNLYPTDKKPGYGIFVKNTEKNLINSGFIVDKAVISKTPVCLLHKVILYAIFYVTVFYKALSGDAVLIYAHFVSHVCLPLYFVSLIKNVKFVVNVHGGDIAVEGVWRRFIHFYFLNALIKKIFMRSVLIIAPSRYYKNLIISLYGAAVPEIFVSPSGGVDALNFKPLDKILCRRKFLIPEDNFVTGYVSRIEKNKGWRVFLEAAALFKKKRALKDFTLLITGDGSQRAEFEKTATELGLREFIVFERTALHGELEVFYSAMDVFIFPTFKESLGLVGIEALACGVPVIGSRIGALCDYIMEGKNGFFFGPGSASELCEKLEAYYVLSTAAKEKMRCAALKTAERFDSKLTALRLSEKLNAIK